MNKYILVASVLAGLSTAGVAAEQVAAQSANPAMPNLANMTPEQVAATKTLVRRSVGHPVEHPELVPPVAGPQPFVQIPAGGGAVVAVPMK